MLIMYTVGCHGSWCTLYCRCKMSLLTMRTYRRTAFSWGSRRNVRSCTRRLHPTGSWWVWKILLFAGNFITDRIQRMGKGNVFSLFTAGGGRGGTPRCLPPRPRHLPPGHVRMGGGGTPRYLLPGQGTYLPWDRTAYGVLDTLRSVCLLRLRRRTFLFHIVWKEKELVRFLHCTNKSLYKLYKGLYK